MKRTLFSKAKNRIVAVIMGMLTLIFAGAILTIFLTTWYAVYQKDQKILAQFTEEVAKGNDPKGIVKEQGIKRQKIKKAAVLYLVHFSAEGEVLDVMNDLKPILNDEELVALASTLLNNGKEQGIGNNFIYRITTQRSGNRYVTLMDNTLMVESTTVLFKNTLIYGCISLVLLFAVSVLLSGRIVRPMEKIYEKQEQFISNAGHELKTPVSAINANAELLRRDVGESRWLDNILFENKRMKELVTQLLDLARAENMEPAMNSVDFSHLVEGCVLPFEAFAFEKGFVMEIEVESDIHVLGDNLRLEQLITTLTDNAITHAQEKNGQNQICIILKKEGKMATLEISNPGNNISREEQERIFERFYRSDCSRELNGHYGLGLAIARAIVEAHHGSITVRSKEQRTTFLIKLPIGDETI